MAACLHWSRPETGCVIGPRVLDDLEAAAMEPAGLGWMTGNSSTPVTTTSMPQWSRPRMGRMT